MNEQEHKTSRRYYRKVQPKLLENKKTKLIATTGSTSADLRQFSVDFYYVMQVCAKKLPKPIYNPINDSEELQLYMSRTDTSLFLHTSHTKKRPNNVVFGRTFDGKIYYQNEFELQNYLGLSDIKSLKPNLVSQPVILFSGDKFENDPLFINYKSMLLDIFGSNQQIKKLHYDGVQWAMLFAAVSGEMIKVRSYILNDNSDNGLKKCLLPVHLSQMGFSFNLVPRRNSFDYKAFNSAMKHPNIDSQNNVVAEPQKNVYVDDLGRKMGVLHISAGDYQKLNLRKYYGHQEPGEEVQEEDLLEFEEEEEEQMEQE